MQVSGSSAIKVEHRRNRLNTQCQWNTCSAQKRNMMWRRTRRTQLDKARWRLVQAHLFVEATKTFLVSWHVNYTTFPKSTSKEIQYCNHAICHNSTFIHKKCLGSSKSWVSWKSNDGYDWWRCRLQLGPQKPILKWFHMTWKCLGFCSQFGGVDGDWRCQITTSI